MSTNTTLAERAMFFVKNIRQPFVNASVVPSSATAARSMLEDIDFSKIKTIVELGPGTGPYTAELIKRASRNSTIILIELDPDYAALLRRKFGDRVIVENVGAERLGEVLRRHSIERPDLIVSALPFAPRKQMQALFKSIKNYTDQGTIFRFEIIFRPTAYPVYEVLPIQKRKYVWRNFPPMWVYGIN